MGADLNGSAFWGRAGQCGSACARDCSRMSPSLTNLGIIAPAPRWLVASWRRGFDQPVTEAARHRLGRGDRGGVAARLLLPDCFGCNVGAFFSGISRGSLMAGSVRRRSPAPSSGVKLRARLGFEGAPKRRGQP